MLFSLLFGNPQNARADEPASCLQGNSANLILHNFVTRPVNGDDSTSLLGFYQRDLQNLRMQMIAGYAGRRTCSLEADRNLSNLHVFLSDLYRATDLPKISPACIYGSLQRQNTTSTYFCQIENGKMTKTSTGAPGPKGPCMTFALASYLSWATNKAIACLNDPANPINPLLIFKKFNNETGFNFTSSYQQGVGLGQLTTSAIKEVNDNTQYIQNILSSTRPECEPFKSALRDPPTNARKNVCALIEPSEGLARNLIYSLAYFLRIRDHYLKAFGVNGDLNKMGITSADYRNYIALAAYGPESFGIFPKMLEAAKASPKNYFEFEKKAAHSSQYLKETENTFSQSVASLDPDEKDCLIPMKTKR